jgi:hypothetical protein
LLALVRVNQKYDFVVTHCISSWVEQSPASAYRSLQ